MIYPERLIEVDLPIARISAHARRERSIRYGHISTLHIWWVDAHGDDSQQTRFIKIVLSICFGMSTSKHFVARSTIQSVGLGDLCEQQDSIEPVGICDLNEFGIDFSIPLSRTIH